MLYVRMYIYIYIYMYLMDNVPQLYPKYGWFCSYIMLYPKCKGNGRLRIADPGSPSIFFVGFAHRFPKKGDVSQQATLRIARVLLGRLWDRRKRWQLSWCFQYLSLFASHGPGSRWWPKVVTRTTPWQPWWVVWEQWGCPTPWQRQLKNPRKKINLWPGRTRGMVLVAWWSWWLESIWMVGSRGCTIFEAESYTSKSISSISMGSSGSIFWRYCTR